jgi:hypothetical protein
MANHRDKATYRTYNQALGVLLRASKKSGDALRIYKCAECNGFHLTKQRRGPRPNKEHRPR